MFVAGFGADLHGLVVIGATVVLVAVIVVLGRRR